jgi:hypothetical protein
MVGMILGLTFLLNCERIFNLRACCLTRIDVVKAVSVSQSHDWGEISQDPASGRLSVVPRFPGKPGDFFSVEGRGFVHGPLLTSNFPSRLPDRFTPAE